MTTIPLDEKTLTSLVEPKRLVAIADAGGRVVGFFAPIGMDQAAHYAAAAAHAYPLKDARQSDDNGKRYTTAEVLAHLKSLEKN